mmetsp:Transcript_7133/g.10409  ORF Transcript_7133/g.10409 Transcript_7133/m.10409 type:complete len:108 (+) Transcript_7133:288-611(+)
MAKTIGPERVGSGTTMQGPPGFGTGTDSNRCEMHRSNGKSELEPHNKCKWLKNLRKAVQYGYRLIKQIVLFSNVVISSNPVSRKSSPPSSSSSSLDDGDEDGDEDDV